MNRFRKATVCILTSMIFLLTSCADDDGGSVSDSSLYTRGLEVVSVIQEMAGSEQYIAFHNVNSDMHDIITSAGTKDFSVPKSVYKISVLNYSFYNASMDGLSDTLTQQLEMKMFYSIPQIINAQGGVNMFAVSSICVAQKTFVTSEQTKSTIYLYTFNQGSPIAVTFTAGEENTVHASGMFIMHGGENFNTVQSVEEFFKTYDIDIKAEEVTQ